MPDTFTTEAGVDSAVIQTPQAPAMDPVEEAAMTFTKLLPYVRQLGSAMPSQKGVVRVLHALAEFPLGDAKPRLLTEGERQLFHVMMELSGVKSTIIQDLMKKNMELEKLKQTATEQVADTSVTTEMGVKSE